MKVNIWIGFVALSVAGMGCGGKADSAQGDPNRPAVVKGPPIILPADTAKPDTMPAHQRKANSMRGALVDPYAVIAAGVGFGDPKLLGSVFAPDAVVKYGDSTYTGANNVVNSLLRMNQRQGLKDLTHASHTLNWRDSTYTDSGYYTMKYGRDGAPLREERGTYVAVWEHVGSGTSPWLLHRDVLTPSNPSKAPKKP
jgi:hypothetical protein